MTAGYVLGVHRLPTGRSTAALADTVCVAALLGVVLVCVAPALRHLGTQPLGELNRHAIDAVWLHFLTAAGLFDAGGPTLASPAFGDPAPLDVLREYADVGNPVVSAPLALWFGPVAAYNVHALLLAWLAGGATYGLGRVLGLARPAAWMAGVLAVVMEPLWFAVRWGEDDVAALGLLPAVFAIAFAVVGGARRFWGGVLLGAAWGLVGWFNSYYLLFLGLFLPVVLLPELRDGLRPAALRGVGVLLGLALVWGPRTLLGFRTSRLSVHFQGRNWIRGWDDLTAPPSNFMVGSSLDLGSLLDPWSVTRLAKARMGQGEGCLYLGLGVLVLAVVGLVAGRMAGRRRLAGIALAAGLLALGPWLRADEALVRWGDWAGVPMPAGLLGAVFPPLRRLDHPFRFVVVTFVVLAPLAASGIGVIAGRLSTARPARAALAALLLAAALAERLVATPGAFPVRAAVWRPFPAEYSALAGRPGAVFLAQWPPPDEGSVQQDANRYQRAAQVLVHRRALVVDPAAPWLSGAVSCATLDTSLRALAARGVTTLLVHPDLDRELATFRAPGALRTPYATQAAWATQNLSTCLGAPDGERVLTWALSAAAAPDGAR